VLLVVYYCCSLIIAPHRFLQVRGNYIRCILWYIVCYCFPHHPYTHATTAGGGAGAGHGCSLVLSFNQNHPSPRWLITYFLLERATSILWHFSTLHTLISALDEDRNNRI